MRRKVSRRRFNDELGAGVGVAGDVDDGESSTLSCRTNKSSVLILHSILFNTIYTI